MVKDLPATDTLRLLAAVRLQPGETAPQLPPADEDLVAKLNNNYRVLYPVALNAAPSWPTGTTGISSISIL